MMPVQTVADRSIPVIQGEFNVSASPQDVMSTVLGSCVAVCLHDPVRQIGGMNHFLLPFGEDRATTKPVRYGLYAMEMLINALMKEGASKDRLQAKLFGGAKIMADLRDIGTANAAFARDFLRTEGIPCLAESLGGTNARRVVFRPFTGAARVMLVPAIDVPTVAVRTKPGRTGPDDGIDLF
jgi:chemotaxis protein CheD